MNPAVIEALGKPFWGREVPKTKELSRILKIPRRVWTKDEGEELAQLMTELLKTNKGTMSLRAIQAVSLYDLGSYGGLICLVRVGGGKTLIAFLAPYVCEALRPLLLIPANLRNKTKNDMRLYRPHFEISPMMAIESYEMLARAKQAHYLNLTKPDLIICDEAHHLKNTQAAVTRRLKRYLKENPNTKLVFLSGTLTNRSITEYWHLFRWALPHQYVPMPHDFSELHMWSLALDEKVPPGSRVRPGALELLCNEEERELFKKDKLKAVRRAYSRRLVETPGVVATKETFQGTALFVRPLQLELPKVVQDAFQRLRDDWELPDGQPISEGTVAAQHAKELALGFYYRWNPTPPDDWLKARREWCSFVRKVLRWNKLELDTEEQVKIAVEVGAYPRGVEFYNNWFSIKDTFIPNTEPVWLHDFAVRAAWNWAKKKKGIVWVYHRAFGECLEAISGMTYYGEGGFARDGSFIEEHPPGEPLIASINANREGKNLQIWNTNLIVHAMSSGKWWEQVIGRTHREGQKNEVVFDVLASCIEHYQSYYKALGDAIYVQDSTPQVQKLLYAESTMPALEDVEAQVGAMWHANQMQESTSAVLSKS